MTYVKVSNEKNSFHLPAKNNSISLKTIKTYFPEASGLTYEFEDEIRCVNIVNDNLELIHYIDEYKVFYADANKVSTPKRDNVIMEIIDKHKAKSNSSKMKRRVSDGPRTKEVIVGWKYKGIPQDVFKLMPEPVGGCKKLSLDLNKTYSYYTIKNLCIESVKNDDNANFFNNSTIEIGNFQNKIFMNFATEENVDCNDFWEFAYNVRTSNGQLRLYLLTTKKLLTIESQQSSKDKNMVSTSISVTEKLTVSKCHSRILTDTSNKPEVLKRPAAVTGIPSCTKKKSKMSKLNSQVPNDLGKDNLVETTKSTAKSAAVKENIDNSAAAGSYRGVSDFQNHVKLIAKEEIEFTNQLIGEGGYGTVQKVKWFHTLVVVKTMRRGFNDKYIYREISVMNKIRHPNLISIMAVCLDTTHCYLVMEYFDSVNLRNLIFYEKINKKYGLVPHDKHYIAEQICTAICYLHDAINNIIHEDIKPENILINLDLRVKVCDMGLSKSSDLSASLNTTIGDHYKGTPMYMVPELLLREKSASIYSDIWALACVLKEIFVEKPTWTVFSVEDLKTLILMKSVPDLMGIADPLKEVLLNCFDYLPENRPICIKLLEVFQKDEECSDSSDNEDND